jgi:hypothetical protein
MTMAPSWSGAPKEVRKEAERVAQDHAPIADSRAILRFERPKDPDWAATNVASWVLTHGSWACP